MLNILCMLNILYMLTTWSAESHLKAHDEVTQKEQKQKRTKTKKSEIVGS